MWKIGSSGKKGNPRKKEAEKRGETVKKAGKLLHVSTLPEKYGLHYDHKLLITILVLCSFGLIMVYSSSAYVASISAKSGYNEYHYVVRQAIFMLLGITVMLLISKLNYHWLVKVTAPLYALSLLLMVLVDFTKFGVEVNGQKRWLNLIPGVRSLPTYQPAEIVKIAVILVFAYVINRWIRNVDKGLIMLMLIALLVPVAILVLVKNLSSGIIILAIGCLMYFIASRYKKLYVILTVLAILVVIIIYNNPDILLRFPFIKDYQLTRIRVWKDPASDPTDKGYQVLQGLYAIGSGGLFGKGLGSSVQKLGYIPESHNDMIFSIICEELGIFGAVCVVALFAYMIYRFVYIIMRAPDLYGAMIVAGVMIHISVQVILNIAVVTNSMPNTGVTLPFISYGGTSVAILLAEMGMVLSVSNQIIYEK